MSRIINLIATLGATALTGYFIYKVILPNLKDIQLPTLQFPDFSQFQFPQQQQQPQLPQQEEQQQDEEPEQTTDKPTGGTKTTPSPSPPAAAAPAGGTLLWDSNTHGKWNNGQKRIVTEGEGGQGPNGKGIHTAASGNPTFTIDGNGVGHLTSSKFGRIYIYANNYNARLEGSLMFESVNTTGDDISFKIRSRHGNNGHPIGGGSECGGVGASYGADGTLKLKIEPIHGTNDSMAPDRNIGKPVLNKWYKFAFSVWDAGGVINSKFELDGKVVGTGKITGPTQCKDQALFNKESYFWIRLNSTDEKTTIKAAFTNIRLYALGGATTGLAMTRHSMLTEPYLYYGYYNRRRL